MRNGGTREVYLTFIIISYDNGKTQTNYCGCMQRNGFQTIRLTMFGIRQ